LGRRLWDESVETPGQPDARETEFVVAAFERILSRAPSAAELAACRAFLRQQVELYRESAAKAPLAAAAQGAVVASTEPQQRACESLVHVLFNHNDFVTIR